MNSSGCSLLRAAPNDGAVVEGVSEDAKWTCTPTMARVPCPFTAHSLAQSSRRLAVRNGEMEPSTSRTSPTSRAASDSLSQARESDTYRARVSGESDRPVFSEASRLSQNVWVPTAKAPAQDGRHVGGAADANRRRRLPCDGAPHRSHSPRPYSPRNCRASVFCGRSRLLAADPCTRAVRSVSHRREPHPIAILAAYQTPCVAPLG